MTDAIKITKIGDSAGIILSDEILAQLQLEIGDELHLVQTPDGFRLRARDPSLDRQMAAAEEIMREDRDILRELAK